MPVIALILPDPADVMMMSYLRLTDGLLEAGQAYTIFAQFAIHMGTTVDRLLSAFGESVAQQRMHVEIPGTDELGVGMLPAELLGLPANAFLQHTREQEER